MEDQRPVKDVRHQTVDDWIAGAAIPFSFDPPAAFDAAVDRMMTRIDERVALLGFGEALHGGQDLLHLRNRLFQRLVDAHGYRAIAIESSFPRGRLVNEYVEDQGPASYDELAAAGFSHDFGPLDANRELVEWMRRYNAEPAHPVKLHFHGFDSPTEATSSDSPRHVLAFVLDYLTAIDPASGEAFRRRIAPLLGEDTAWERTEALIDPAQSVGRSPEATQIRIATEDLIAELEARRPELVAKSGRDRYREALQHARVARWLLTYHAETASTTNERVGRLLGLRDALMADNLVHILARQEGRGKVLAFAHTGHLQRGPTEWRTGWPDGPEVLTWWPAGAHLAELLGPAYAVIGTALGVSAANGVGQPEPGTLEARLAAQPGEGVFLPTCLSEGLPMAEIDALPVRSGSSTNFSYLAPLSSRSVTDFDWIAFLDESA